MVLLLLGLLHSAVAGHEGGYLLDALQWERRLTQGPHGDGHELHGIVVRRRAVGAEGAAAAAPVDDGPLAAPAHPDGDRLHDPAAVRLPVAGLDVDMQTCKAVRAVVAVAAPRVIRGAEPAADLTGKGVAAGVVLIIALFQGLSLVFTVHCVFPPDAVFFASPGGMACVKIRRTSRSGHTLR